MRSPKTESPGTNPSSTSWSSRNSTANNIVAPLDERQSMQGATVYIDERGLS